jgi:ubiquinone biosynthesis protein
MALTGVGHVGRLKDIVLILARYGFDDIADRLALPGKLLVHKAMRVDERLTTAERVRLALEELGPTFVKFGQVMSMRADLLPADWLHELRKLHAEVPPVPLAEIRPQIERDLRRPLEEVFVRFDETPIAAASLAQVHRAVLREERRAVAVKVQRPDIRDSIDADFAIMKTIANRLDQRMAGAAMFDLPKLVEEFRRTLFRELDYGREARNMRIFRANLDNSQSIRVPELFERLSSPTMIVMELVDGVSLSDVPAGEPERRRKLARLGLQGIIRQVFRDGFFHADPHPGNIVVGPEDTLYMLDCGMVGRVTEETRFRLTDLIQATIGRDPERLVNVLLDLTEEHERIDRQALQLDVLDILDAYHSVPLEKLRLGRFLSEVADLLNRHKLRLPENLTMVLKTLITAEGVARELHPGLDVVSELRPLISQLVAEHYKPENLWRSVRSQLSLFWSLQRRLPKRLSHIVEKLERGELTMRFEHENLEKLQHTLDNIASRLTVAIIIAAMLIGSSLIVTAQVGPTLFGFPALGVIGYTISGLLGLWIVFSILRSG